MAESRLNMIDSMAVSGGFTLLPSNPESLSGSNITDILSLRASMGITSSDDEAPNQVTFLNTEEIYPSEEDLICTFTKNDDVILEGEDYVAIWSYGENTKSLNKFISSVPVSDECFVQGEEKIYSVRFTAEELPSVSKLYQFCYLSRNNIIGVSSPFSFGTPAESEYVAVEDPNDPGLIVFKSRFSQSNEDLSKDQNEKDQDEKDNLNDESIESLKKEVHNLEKSLKLARAHNKILAKSHDDLLCYIFEYHKQEKEMKEMGGDITSENSVFQMISQDINEVKEVLSDIKNSAAVKEDLNAINELMKSISCILNDCSQKELEKLQPQQSIPLNSSLTSQAPPNSESNEATLLRNISPDIEENNELQREISSLKNEVLEAKETNAFLKSRVAVLELEVCSMNQKKYQLLMDCIGAYEHDNACLKAELENLMKQDCEILSLKSTIASLTLENNILKEHVKSCSVLPSEQANKLLTEMKTKLVTALNETDHLKKQLMELRKQTVGKISLQQNTISKSDDNPESC